MSPPNSGTWLSLASGNLPASGSCSRVGPIFCDLDRLTELSVHVLRDSQSHQCLGEAGAALIGEKYALEKTLARTIEFFRGVVGGVLLPSPFGREARGESFAMRKDRLVN